MYIVKRNYRTNVRRYWEIPGNVYNAILGSLITKNSVELINKNSNARLVYSISDKRYEGLSMMWELLESYSTTEPATLSSPHSFIEDKIPVVNRFKTNFLPCFNRFYELFYINGEKRIPINIVDLMNAEVLAYWFLFSGSRFDNHIIFYTEHLRVEDVDLLIKA